MHTQIDKRTLSRTRVLMFSLKLTFSFSSTRNTSTHNSNHFLPLLGQLPDSAPDTLPLSSHLVWTTFFFLSLTLVRGGKQFSDFRASSSRENLEDQLRASWHPLTTIRMISQFHFTGGPITLQTLTYTHTHAHKQPHTHMLTKTIYSCKHSPTYTQ